MKMDLKHKHYTDSLLKIKPGFSNIPLLFDLVLSNEK